MAVTENGFVKLYRSMKKWEWYQDSIVKSVFIHCLLSANHDDQKWQGVVIERGTFVTSQPHLAYELGISVQQVRTALKKLNSTGEITVKKTNKYSIIKVSNFSSFQDINRQPNSQATVNQQASNSQSTTNKNIKNIKNDKNEKNNTYIGLISSFSDNEDLKTELENFVEMRQRTKGFTVHALELSLSKLAILSSDPAVQTEIVRQSIEKSWKGFFPLKQNQPVQRVQPNQRQDVIPDWKQEEQTEDVDWEEFQKIRQQLKQIENGVN